MTGGICYGNVEGTMDEMDLGDIRDLMQGLPDYKTGDLVRLNGYFALIRDMGSIVGEVVEPMGVSLVVQVIADSVTVFPHPEVKEFPVPVKRRELVFNHLDGALDEEGVMIVQVPVWAAREEWVQ